MTVNGVRYRWRIRQKPTYDEGAFARGFSVAVERIEQPSHCVLLLAADFPRPDNWLNQPSKSVTPKIIAVSIEDALAHGWQPEHAGSAFKHPLHAKKNAKP